MRRKIQDLIKALIDGNSVITGVPGSYIVTTTKSISDIDRDALYTHITASKVALENANTQEAIDQRDSDITNITTVLSNIA